MKFLKVLVVVLLALLTLRKNMLGILERQLQQTTGLLIARFSHFFYPLTQIKVFVLARFGYMRNCMCPRLS